MRLVVAHQAVSKRLARHLLHLGIKRGANRKATLVEFFLTVTIRQFAPDLFGKKARGVVGWNDGLGVDAQRLFFGRFAVSALHEAVEDHALDHVIAAGFSAFALGERVIVVWSLGQSGQIGHFAQRQLVHRLIEIVQRGRSHAIVAKAEINFVEIKLEDFFLGVVFFDAQRQQSLARLAGVGLFVAKQEVFGNLLGDGGSTLLTGTGQVCQQSTGNAFWVDAVMRIKVFVFGGNKCLFHQWGNGRAWQIKPPLARIFSQ